MVGWGETSVSSWYVRCCPSLSYFTEEKPDSNLSGPQAQQPPLLQEASPDLPTPGSHSPSLTRTQPLRLGKSVHFTPPDTVPPLCSMAVSSAG